VNEYAPAPDQRESLLERNFQKLIGLHFFRAEGDLLTELKPVLGILRELLEFQLGAVFKQLENLVF
jgi:hypothetical protein